jgi:hypothetical protein
VRKIVYKSRTKPERGSCLTVYGSARKDEEFNTAPESPVCQELCRRSRREQSRRKVLQLRLTPATEKLLAIFEIRDRKLGEHIELRALNVINADCRARIEN